jgi:hypothetical protein
MPERFRNALPDIEESIHLFVDFHRAGLYAVVYGDIDHWIKNSRLLNENQTNRMVDILMEVYPVYRKERTMVQEFIDNQGLFFSWGKVLEMRAKVDSVEAVKAKQK